MFGIKNLYDPEFSDLVHRIHQALKANYIMTRDVEYLVDKDNEIQLIDQFTGRVLHGREYSDGLQQAIQAKENVKIKQETVTLATITYQNFFRLFKKLSGMTGTAKTEEEEFRKIYNMRVVSIPTNRPIQRVDAVDFVYESKEAKNIYVSLPVYMLDHSGTYFSTTGFSDVDPDRWDWGQLGIIYCTEESAKKWFGYLPDKETLKAQLNNEVELYNDYMNGAWFAFYIEGKDGEIEDSCGGFFQNGNFADVLKDMKEYTDKDYHSLFDKLAVKYEKQACM